MRVFREQVCMLLLEKFILPKIYAQIKEETKELNSNSKQNGGPSSQASHVCLNFPLWIIFYSNIDIKEEVYYPESGTQLEQVGTCVHLVRSHRQLWLTASKPWLHLRGGCPSHWCCLDLQKSEKKRSQRLCCGLCPMPYPYLPIIERERERLLV